VEREREIDAFMPEEFWRIDGVFTPDPAMAAGLGELWRGFLATKNEKGDPPTRKAQADWLAEHSAFRAELAKVNGKRFKAATVDDALPLARALGFVVENERREEVPDAKGPAKNRLTLIGSTNPAATPFTVANLTQRDNRRKPPAPFTTATLQQTASAQLRFTARRTMQIAQQLYEGMDIPGEGHVGLITYMRTDSRNLSAEAVGVVREMIDKDYGSPYVPDKPNIYASGERAQEAHEAIRPTDPRRRPKELKNRITTEQFMLYELIWKRFVSCQMTPAVWKITEADIVAQAGPDEATFRAMGRTLAFDGWMRVAGVPHSADEQTLPDLARGQAVGPVGVDPTQHFTQPPPRFTEASLVKALEADNIGRPSTYAAIIQTIQDRKYVELEQRAFHPTDLGTVVNDKLVQHFPKVFQVRFTAHMEDELDKVEKAEADWVAVLHEFYGPFAKQLTAAGEEMVHAKLETEPSEYQCPDCGAPMEYRFGKNGKFLSCSAYPECKKALPIDRQGRPAAPQHTDIACPKCATPMMLRKGRFGPFLSCPRYPECDGVVNLDRKGCVKHPAPPPLAIEMPCPKCESTTMNLRRGKRGPWISCARYPKCRGRVAWKGLDEETQKKLELALLNHEKANPIPPLKKIDGTEVPEDYKPQTVQDENNADTPDTAPAN
jgi:DNA topoisomerase-1